MVHRIIGPRWAAAVGALSVLAFWTVPARAFCRFTTCAAMNAPPECKARDANGCYVMGIPLSWKQQCVSYSVSRAASPKLDLDYAAALDLIGRGFNIWPSASCSDGMFPSIAVMTYPALTCDRVAYYSTGPNANGVIFRDTGWTHDITVIALTSVMFNARTGQILGADMEINSQDYPLTPQDVAYVAAHEAGHFLGLDHSNDPTALMFSTYSRNAIADPALQSDDAAGICAAYPATREAPVCDFEPDKGFAPDCGGNVVGSCAVAADAGASSSGSALLAAAVLILIAAGRVRARGQTSQRGRRARSV